jgi:hypothetical protein
MRLVWMIVVSITISFAQTILTVVPMIQFFCHVTTNRQPNERLVDFGTTLSIWFAKEARHQTAVSEVRPWPWSDLD